MSEYADVAQLKKGDIKEFEKMFSLWYNPLCNYANSILHNTAEAEDIVQRMFCKLWDKHADLEIHSSVKSYLYRAVHNDCLNEIKHKKIKLDYAAYKVHAESNQVETDITSSELEQEIAKAIDGLPPQCKKVFELSRYQQLSYAEISSALNLSVNTVENHISKALKMLRKGLKDYLPMMLYFFIH